MKTRGKKKDYKELAGMGSTNSPTEPSIEISSGDDLDFDMTKEIKEEPLSDNSDIPLNTALAQLKNHQPSTSKHLPTDKLSQAQSTSKTSTKHEVVPVKRHQKVNLDTDSDESSSEEDYKPVKKIKKLHKKRNVSSEYDESSDEDIDVKKKDKKQSKSKKHKQSSKKIDTDSESNTSCDNAKKKKNKKITKNDSDTSFTSLDSESDSSSHKKKEKKYKKTTIKSSKSSSEQKAKKQTFGTNSDSESKELDSTSLDSDSDSSSDHKNKRKYKKTTKACSKSNCEVTPKKNRKNKANKKSDSTDSEQCHKKRRTKKNCTSSEDTASSSDSDEPTSDKFLSTLNDNATLTSRDLKAKHPYKLLSIKVTKETGFKGLKYNKAVGVFAHPKNEKKKLAVVMPKPIANYDKKILKELNKRISKGKNPCYVVQKIESKKRPDGAGHYDCVTFKWL